MECLWPVPLFSPQLFDCRKLAVCACCTQRGALLSSRLKGSIAITSGRMTSQDEVQATLMQAALRSRTAASRRMQISASLSACTSRSCRANLTQCQGQTTPQRPPPHQLLAELAMGELARLRQPAPLASLLPKDLPTSKLRRDQGTRDFLAARRDSTLTEVKACQAESQVRWNE